jgi:hypothetical protein
MLMERHHIDHEAARYLLMDESRSQRQPLADLARSVIAGSSGTAG